MRSCLQKLKENAEYVGFGGVGFIAGAMTSVFLSQPGKIGALCACLTTVAATAFVFRQGVQGYGDRAAAYGIGFFAGRYAAESFVSPTVDSSVNYSPKL